MFAYYDHGFAVEQEYGTSTAHGWKWEKSPFCTNCTFDTSFYSHELSNSVNFRNSTNESYCSRDFISNPFQMLHCSRAYFCLSLSAQYNSKCSMIFFFLLYSVHFLCEMECNLPAAKTIDLLIWFYIHFFMFFSFLFLLANGNYSEALLGTTQALEIVVTETHRFKSMSSIKEALMLASPLLPPVANQLNNKYFVNQVQSNLSNTLQNIDQTVISNAHGIVETSTVATSQASVGANKYFVSNVSLLSIENVTSNGGPSTSLPLLSSPSSSKSRFKTTVNPLSASNKNKTVQHHHHHGKTNGSASTGRTHFQIAQKQLTLSKNIRTEPPPMLNHILDSLSVSNSKHLHHGHRFVYFYLQNDWGSILCVYISDETKSIGTRMARHITLPLRIFNASVK